jgi:hypothetical protein
MIGLLVFGEITLLFGVVVVVVILNFFLLDMPVGRNSNFLN